MSNSILPTAQELRAIALFAKHEGDYFLTAREFRTLERQLRTMIASVSCKAGIPRNERSDSKKLAARLTAFAEELKETQEMVKRWEQRTGKRF